MLPQSFHYPLVVLSVLVAVFVSNTALSLFQRVAHYRGLQSRVWMFGGAGAMGCGIWSTHFVGMLALSLPIPLTYDITTTATSLIVAITSSFAALYVAARRPVSRVALSASALLLGGGVSAMHYSGMSAIQIVPLLTYSPSLVGLSILVAVAGSFGALVLFLRATGPNLNRVLVRAAAAGVLGISIGGMHYIGILGTRFGAGAYCTGVAGVDSQWLAVMVASVAFAVTALTTLMLIYDGYLAAKAQKYHERLELANAQLHHAATHDALTGLPNRLQLAAALDELIRASNDASRQFAVMLIDLDRFKEVNDSLGHLAGDELLRVMTSRLRTQVRAGTSLARLGGDEFVVVVDDLSGAADADLVAARLQEAIAQPVLLRGLAVHVSGSVGIALFPEHGTDSSMLLQRADAAMYFVKNNARGGRQFYSTEIPMPSRERLEVDDGLRKALVARELELYYQPKVDVRSGRIEGAEALIRWRHPQRGLVAPAEFIPLAEETGLIVPMGEWALREACRQAHAWQYGSVGRLRVAVNVSAKQFQTCDFADVVARIVRESGLDPSLLELELTESAVMRNPRASIGALQRLTDLGVAVSLDDFGTGYSSLSHLRRLPLTKLKIDRSFIQDLATDPGCAQIVRAIVSLGHNLHLKVIAEGVETAQQLRFLREVGCDKYQGYYFSRPIPAHEFARMVEANRATHPASLSPTGVHKALAV